MDLDRAQSQSLPCGRILGQDKTMSVCHSRGVEASCHPRRKEGQLPPAEKQAHRDTAQDVQGTDGIVWGWIQSLFDPFANE
jgi:hypothetical protein